MDFSQIIKDLRLEFNLKQKDLAKSVYKTNSTICDWECGRTEPSIADLILLADFFSVSTDYLIGRTKDNQVTPAESVPSEEKELINAFRKLDVKNQYKILGYVKALGE